MKAMHKKVIAVSLSAILIPTIFSTAYAHSDFGHKRAHNAHKMLKKLDLTDNQKENVKAIIKASRVDGKQDMTEFKSLKQALEVQIKQDKWDEAEVAKIVGELHALKTTRMENSLSTKQQVWALLTPEQQAKYVTLQQTRLAKIEDKTAKRTEKRQAKFVKKLGLSDEQQAVVEPLLAQLAENRTQMRDAKLASKAASVATLAESGEFSLALNSETAVEMQQLAVDNASLHHRIWHNLTPEQQDKFERFMSKKKRGMKKHRRGQQS